MKIDEMRGRIEFEQKKIENTMGSEFTKQEGIHVRLTNMNRDLNTETTTCNMKAMSLDRRIEDMIKQIGTHAGT